MKTQQTKVCWVCFIEIEKMCVIILLVIFMELPKRKSTRIENFDYSQNGTYFITVCTQSRRKVLSKIFVGTPLPGCPHNRLIELLWHGKIAQKHIQNMNAFYDYISVDKYVIMPDHIHFLITVHVSDGHPRRGVPTERSSLIAQFVGTFKRFCNQEYGGNIWQGRYYDHVIRNQQDYNEVWEYIENNPLKWALKQQDRD